MMGMTTELLHMSKRDIDRHVIIKKVIDKTITRIHAAKLLQLTVRHITRLKSAVLAHGATALIHKQRGQPSHHRLDEEERIQIVALLKETYNDFGPTFAAEKLREINKIDHDPKTIRSIQIAEGLWKPRRSRSKDDHRSWRQRRSAFGEMIQFDGSYHDWFEGRGGIQKACLLAAIDDATSRIVALRFVAHEGIVPVFSFWKLYMEIHGKPRSIYMDKFSTYKMNSAVAKENPDLKTQFQRALESLEVESIFAHSPQAKGRVERLNDTLQDRLPKELRLAHISTVEDANIFLEQTFIPDFNARFPVEPVSSADLHRQLTTKERVALDSIFSRHEERTVLNDFTFSFKKQWYQLTEGQPVTICKKDEVIVEEWLDETLHVRLRGKELNVLVLPQRPKSVRVPFVLPKRAPVSQKPSMDHPWRGSYKTPSQRNA